MQPLFTIAIVGRPNVGKSHLFNKLARRRLSIVHDQPGVTRDIVATEVDNQYLLMDTGGLGLAEANTSQEITNAVTDQVDFAIQAANLILFVVDGMDGLTNLDEIVIEKLRKYSKPIILLVNKIDSPHHLKSVDAFHKLGINPVIATSAEHNQGLEETWGAIRKHFNVITAPIRDLPPERIRICFAGRPNVGKSSITNTLLKSNRLIVSDVPGTTRDAISLDLDYTDKQGNLQHLTLVDTAGLKSRGKIKTSVEFFALIRSQRAITRADIVFLVLDAKEGVTEMDKKLAGSIIESGKSIAIVVNKWDYALKAIKEQILDNFKNEGSLQKSFIEAIQKELFFLPSSPIVFTSALTGYSIETILETALSVNTRACTPLPTSRVNDIIGAIMAKKAPAIVHGKRFKVYYALQVGLNPFKIKIFCNRAARLQDNYKRYLESNFNKAFDLKGCPVQFEIIGKPERARTP